MKISGALMNMHTIQESVYKPSDMTITHLQQEAESQDYEAYSFAINDIQVRFRRAKITPTKTGQFVTLWKRNGSGSIIPFDVADSVDVFVVHVQTADECGQFIFPKKVLWEKGFVSKDGKGGKRAMRVYPPWDMVASVQAQKTQAWQLRYFVEIKPALDSVTMKKLFFCENKG